MPDAWTTKALLCEQDENIILIWKMSTAKDTFKLAYQYAIIVHQVSNTERGELFISNNFYSHFITTELPFLVFTLQFLLGFEFRIQHNCQIEKAILLIFSSYIFVYQSQLKIIHFPDGLVTEVFKVIGNS